MRNLIIIIKNVVTKDSFSQLQLTYDNLFEMRNEKQEGKDKKSESYLPL